MLARFICPDNEQIDVSSCLGSCRLGQRCLTLPTLAVVARDRPWDGRPHVTDLLNGTRQSYLRITKDYAVKPTGRAYALLGSSHHKLMHDSGTWLSEVDVSNNQYHGTLDLLEPDGSGYTLYDMKAFGSYKVAKCLGLVKTNGLWVADPEAADMFEQEMQLNMYRVLLGKLTARKGFKGEYRITSLRLQVTVRDGNTSVATSRGVTEPIYIIPVRRLPDRDVIGYFSRKRKALLQALKLGMAELCTEYECWNNHNKCKYYCDVAEFCVRGRMYKMGR